MRRGLLMRAHQAKIQSIIESLEGIDSQRESTNGLYSDLTRLHETFLYGSFIDEFIAENPSATAAFYAEVGLSYINDYLRMIEKHGAALTEHLSGLQQVLKEQDDLLKAENVDDQVRKQILEKSLKEYFHRKKTLTARLIDLFTQVSFAFSQLMQDVIHFIPNTIKDSLVQASTPFFGMTFKKEQSQQPTIVISMHEWLYNMIAPAQPHTIAETINTMTHQAQEAKEQYLKIKEQAIPSSQLSVKGVFYLSALGNIIGHFFRNLSVSLQHSAREIKQKIANKLLILALHYNNLHMVNHLIKKQGANPNIQGPHGMTPLMEAIKGHDDQMVKFLLSVKADPDIQDHDGHTALHYAVDSQKNEYILKLLLECRADPDRANQCGRTALHAAVEKQHSSLVKLLLQYGANPNLKDDQGHTVIDDLPALKDLVVDAASKQIRTTDSTLEERKLPLVLTSSSTSGANSSKPLSRK
ncbi:hypothetical protein EBS02_04035 [bacterium]|nr:hypothetical protein [bacterium]NBX72525.1 hypothetical protein [bacterium]